MNWNEIWDQMCKEKPYNSEVQICLTQEEVNRANADGMPILGVEEDHQANHLRNCPYIIQLDRESILRIKNSKDIRPEEHGAQKEAFRWSRPEEHGAQEEASGCSGLMQEQRRQFLLLNSFITEEDLRKIYCRHHQIPMRILETERTILREISMEDLPALFQMYREPGFTDYIDPLPSPEEERQELKHYISEVYGLYNYGLWAVTDLVTGDLIGRAGIEQKSTGLPDEILTEMKTVSESSRILENGTDLEDSGTFENNGKPVESGAFENNGKFEDGRTFENNGKLENNGKTEDAGALELSYGIAPSRQNQGLGEEVVHAVIQYAREELPGKMIYARVMKQNVPSIRLLRHFGFQCWHEKEDGIQYYVLTIPALINE